ncbi:MAG TPA: CcmD family protein [bacterium]|nr:CcmD family protein [bacterium]
MTYLFWAFAVVWIGLFLYLYRLVKRSRRLERELDELTARVRMGADAGSGRLDGAGVAPPPASLRR